MGPVVSEKNLQVDRKRPKSQNMFTVFENDENQRRESEQFLTEIIQWLFLHLQTRSTARSAIVHKAIQLQKEQTHAKMENSSQLYEETLSKPIRSKSIHQKH